MSNFIRTTFAEKKKLADLISGLTPGQIGKVVAILEEKCQDSVKNGDGNNVQILVDFINKKNYDLLIEFDKKKNRYIWRLKRQQKG